MVLYFSLHLKVQPCLLFAICCIHWGLLRLFWAFKGHYQSGFQILICTANINEAVKGSVFLNTFESATIFIDCDFIAHFWVCRVFWELLEVSTTQNFTFLSARQALMQRLKWILRSLYVCTFTNFCMSLLIYEI